MADPRPPAFVPKVGLPYPVGRMVCGRIVARLAPALFQIDLSGKLYTAELSTEQTRRSLSPGDPVTVKVVSKFGSKAVLQIVEPDFPDIDSPTRDDLARLAQAAGWPNDEAAIAMVSALVPRRMPLRSDVADGLYKHLSTLENPTTADAEKFLS